MERPSDRAPGRLRGRFVPSILAALALVGCGRAEIAMQPGSAREELRQAAEATLASKSFVMHMRLEGDPDANGEGIIIYQAPDRARSSAPRGVDTIVVGRTMYSRVPAPELPASPPALPEGMAPLPMPPMPNGLSPDMLSSPSPVAPSDLTLPGAFPALPEGSYWRREAPASNPLPVEGFLVQLRLVAMATDVEKTGSTYHYRAAMGRAAVSGDAHVDHGRIDHFTFVSADPAWKHIVTRFRMSDYDSAPSVEAPPADKVFDAPTLEPCGPDGEPRPGQVVCGDTGFQR